MQIKLTTYSEYPPEDEGEWLNSLGLEMEEYTSKLDSFNIMPTGESKIRTSHMPHFNNDLHATTISRSFEGHWLDFLHARRAGILNRPARIICD